MDDSEKFVQLLQTGAIVAAIQKGRGEHIAINAVAYAQEIADTTVELMAEVPTPKFRYEAEGEEEAVDLEYTLETCASSLVEWLFWTYVMNPLPKPPWLVVVEKRMKQEAQG